MQNPKNCRYLVVKRCLKSCLDHERVTVNQRLDQTKDFLTDVFGKCQGQMPRTECVTSFMKFIGQTTQILGSDMFLAEATSLKVMEYLTLTASMMDISMHLLLKENVFLIGLDTRTHDIYFKVTLFEA